MFFHLQSLISQVHIQASVTFSPKKFYELHILLLENSYTDKKSTNSIA